jgi:enoyl-CoA hydratase
METEAFAVERGGTAHVATVTLSRADAGNKLLTHEIRALGRAIRELGSDPGVKVVLLRGRGDHFCLGRQPDPGNPAAASALAMRTGVTEPILDLYADVRATPVPVLAVVHGEARGFGCALVGQCDLAVAAEGAQFSMPEMDVNLPPTLAISAVLGKVPPKRLLHLVYTRDRIPAQEALALGILSEVVPAAGLEDAVARTVSRLTDRSRPALCAVKEYMGVAPYVDPAAASRLAANILSVVLSSKEG